MILVQTKNTLYKLRHAGFNNVYEVVSGNLRWFPDGEVVTVKIHGGISVENPMFISILDGKFTGKTITTSPVESIRIE